jgi:hypothetical protein
MVERNAGVPEDRRIVFRIGIHLGDVVEESDGDLMGDGVNTRRGWKVSPNRVRSASRNKRPKMRLEGAMVARAAHSPCDASGNATSQSYS